MSLIKKYLNGRLYLLTVLIVSMAFWLIAFLSRYEKIDINIQPKIENISLMSYGIICFILLVLNRNTFYFIPWVIFIPFVFARPFTALEIPTTIFYASGIMILGLVLNLIIYRPKLKLGHFFIGLAVLCVAFVLGGINVPNDNSRFQVLITAVCAAFLLLLYVVISSSAKTDFKNICRLFTYLGIFLAFELAVYYKLQPDLKEAILTKDSSVGWGVSNNIALMLLFTFPFTLYLVLISKNVKTVFYILIMGVQCLAILFTYSRGAIFSMLVGVACMIPLSIWKAKDRVSTAISITILLSAIGLVILYFYKNRPEDFNRFIDVAFRMDLDDLNGRTPIYEDCIKSLKEFPIFGKGVLSTFQSDGTYAWGHSTILQTVRTMGYVGVIAMSFHLIQKYFVLIYRPTLWKIIVAASFAISGLYGLFDVSYYFINYMIPLILAMAIIESLFKKGGEDEYELL